MRKILAMLVSSMIFISLAGCNTTQGVGYENPQYANYRMSDVAVYVDSTGDTSRMIENYVVEMLEEQGIRARSVRDYAKFSKGQEEFVEKVWGTGVGEVLVIASSDSSGSSTIGYQSFGNASTFGSQTSMNVTTTPMTRISRAIRLSAKLFNREGDIVWAGDAKREASGLVFVGDETMSRNAAKAVIQALESSGTI